MTPQTWAPDALATRFWSKVDRTSGLFACWTWTGAFSKKNRGRPARPVFWIAYVRPPGEAAKGSPQLLVPAARMALALTDDVPPWDRLGLEACHRPAVCANPACVNPAHLYWGTAEENRRDRYERCG